MLRELAGSSNIKVTAMGYSWNGIFYTYIYNYIYIHSLNQFDVWFFNHYNAERPRKPLAVLINLKPWYGHPGPLVPGFHIHIIHYSDLFGPERYYITISLPCCRIFLNVYSQSQMPQTKYIHIMCRKGRSQSPRFSVPTFLSSHVSTCLDRRRDRLHMNLC